MKILEITNVDFSMRQFLFPLMQALRAEGHDVTGICADGPLLAQLRADGLRVVCVPMSRTLSPRAQWRAWRALVRLIQAEKPPLVSTMRPANSTCGARSCMGGTLAGMATPLGETLTHCPSAAGTPSRKRWRTQPDTQATFIHRSKPARRVGVSAPRMP